VGAGNHNHELEEEAQMKPLIVTLTALVVGLASAPAFAADPVPGDTPDSAIASAPVRTNISAAAMANPDPQALSSFSPMEVQDALVLPEGILEFQGYSLYTYNPYTKTNQSTFLMDPTLKIGAMHHVQLDITAPYSINQNTANTGSAGVDGYYQFTDPTPYFPALAAQAGWTFTGYGPGKTSNSYFVRGLMTQWLGSDTNAPRLDLNVGWTHVTTPLPGDRKDLWAFGVGYTQQLNTKMAFAADITHDYLPVNLEAENFVDAGLRYVVGDAWTVTGAVGAGFAQRSPAFRTLFSFQKDFSLF
jgi:hypothetical protein